MGMAEPTNSENYYIERHLQKYYYHHSSKMADNKYHQKKLFDFTKTSPYTKPYVLDNTDQKQRVAEDLFIFWTDYLWWC